MFHFISVITDIQLKDFKTISKVPYKGNYKWVWNQLRLSADHKFCGVLDPRKVSRSLGRETHRRDLCQALPPRLPVHLFRRSGHFFQTTVHAALWLRCPRWQLCGSFWGLCLGCSTRAGGWFHDCCLSPGWWRSLRATCPSYSWSQKSSSLQSLWTPNTPHRSVGSSQSPKPNTSTTGKPELSRHNLPVGKLNGLESFIPEWSLLSDTSKHIARAHRGLLCQTAQCSYARTVSSFPERNKPYQ